MRCEHCPVAGDAPCRGEKASYFCRMSDPADARFSPKYVDFLVEEASGKGVRPGPSFLKRLGNFAKAAAAFAADRFGLVDDHVKEARLAKCRECSYYDEGWCRHQDCGCLLEAKSRAASQACPIGEWEAVPGVERGCKGCGGVR